MNRATNPVTFLFCLFGFLTLFGSTAQGARFLNLDFERSTRSGQAIGWFHGGQGYEATVDTTVAYSGKKSLRLRRVGVGEFGVGTSEFPIEDARGEHLRYTGYIKTDGVSDGYAGLWWRVDGKQGVLGFDNMGGRGPTGTTPWTRVTIELDIDSTLTNINFGVLMPGSGTAWFDALQIELDGQVYPQTTPAAFLPDEGQLDWVRRQALTFATDDPQASDEDLRGLKAMIGDVQIVALGEGTHGTAEFFRMKHRLVEFLCCEMGFRVFAIEANMPEARLINEYVLHGKGDPKEGLAGLYFWTWYTQEVLDLIEWMREFNASGKGHIEFWGFDMQTPTVAMDSVRNFVARVEPAYSDSVDQGYRKVKEAHQALQTYRAHAPGVLVEPWRGVALSILRHLERNRERYLSGNDSMTVEWGLQNARVVVQALECLTKEAKTRDESMADNVDWILSHQPPGTKIVLWAHNGHVGRRNNDYEPMGSFLAQRHGSGLATVGFAFHEGQYTAIKGDKLGTYGTSPSEPGSVEYALHQAGLPRLILDLRKTSDTSPESAWLRKELDFRSIGAAAMEYAFSRTVITDQFDLLVYFEQSHPTAVFGRPSELKKK